MIYLKNIVSNLYLMNYNPYTLKVSSTELWYPRWQEIYLRESHSLSFTEKGFIILPSSSNFYMYFLKNCTPHVLPNASQPGLFKDTFFL